MLKRWNFGLIIGTFLLSIFGTFITRSGVIASVHSFTQSNVGYFFLAFLVVTAVLAFTLLYTRWALLQAEVQLESVLSREAAFLFNNLLLVGIAFSVLWGTLFPILSELVRGSKITVGPPFFNRVNVPLGLLLLGLTGIGPLIAWRKASAAARKRASAGTKSSWAKAASADRSCTTPSTSNVVNSSVSEICAAKTSLAEMPFESASYNSIIARSRESERSSSAGRRRTTRPVPGSRPRRCGRRSAGSAGPKPAPATPDEDLRWWPTR